MIARGKYVRKPDHDERAVLRAVDQFHLGAQNNGAGTLSPHQRPGNLKSVFRKQLGKVVARDAPWNFREALPYSIGVAVANRLELSVDLTAAAALSDDGIQIGFTCLTDSHAQAVVRENIEFLDVIFRSTCGYRVNTTRVIADHAAQRAVLVRGRIGPDRQMMLFRFVAKGVEDQARLHPGVFPLRVDFENLIQIFRKINDNRRVAALPGQTGPATPAQNGRIELAAQRNGSDYVFIRSRYDHADGHLPVNR